MPKFTVNTPDGKTYTVNAPAGATHEDAIAHVQKTYYNIDTTMPGKTSLMEKAANSPIGGVLRGLRDPIDAGAQLLTRGIEAIAPAGSPLESMMRKERENVEAINKAAETDYRENWRRGEDPGLDIGRVAGNIAGAVPLAAFVPGMSAATLPARMAAGGGAGAISAAFQPVNEGDFWPEKAGQIAGGAASGALAVPVIEKAMQAIGKVSQRMAARLTSDHARKIANDLGAAGVDYSQLSKETQESILKDAEKALKAGGKLDMNALALKYDFEKLGMKPTLGQVSRDPMQFQFERNNAGIEGAGETLSQRFNEQNSQLVGALGGLRKAAGGSDDAYTGIARIQSDLRALNDAKKQGVSALYDAAKNKPGRLTQLNPHRFTNDLNDVLDRELGGYALPSGLQNSLNKIAKGDAPFGIQEAEQLKKMANQYWDKTGQDGARNFAITQFKEALNREISSSSDDLMRQAQTMASTGAMADANAAQEVAQSFKIATKAARQQKRALEKVPALKFAIDNEMPDPKFIERFVVNARPRELLNLRAQLRKNPETWEEIRGQVLEYIKTKATNNQPDEFAKFTQAGFSKALNSVNDAKLKILFSPQEIAQLKSIGRVGKAIQIAPEGVTINRSGTSQAMANLLSRLSHVPYLRELAINPLMNHRLQSQVNSALNPSAPMIPKPSALPPEFVRALNLPLAVGAYPILQPASER